MLILHRGTHFCPAVRIDNDDVLSSGDDGNDDVLILLMID